jgi:hypothetical protein
MRGARWEDCPKGAREQPVREGEKIQFPRVSGKNCGDLLLTNLRKRVSKYSRSMVTVDSFENDMLTNKLRKSKLARRFSSTEVGRRRMWHPSIDMPLHTLPVPAVLDGSRSFYPWILFNLVQVNPTACRRPISSIRRLVAVFTGCQLSGCTHLAHSLGHGPAAGMKWLQPPPVTGHGIFHLVLMVSWDDEVTNAICM